MAKQKTKTQFTDDDTKDKNMSYHLWGIRKRYSEMADTMRREYTHMLWEYVKEGTKDRRCLNGIDKRNWSQLEIRNSNGDTIDVIDTFKEEQT